MSESPRAGRFGVSAPMEEPPGQTHLVDSMLKGEGEELHYYNIPTVLTSYSFHNYNYILLETKHVDKS